MSWLSSPLFSQVGSNPIVPSMAVAGLIIGGMLFFGHHVFHGMSWLLAFFVRKRIRQCGSVLPPGSRPRSPEY